MFGKILGITLALFTALTSACASESDRRDAAPADASITEPRDAMAPDVGVLPDASEDAGTTDADTGTEMEMGTRDAAFPDAAPSPCGATGSACTEHARCATPETPPTNCVSCVPYNRSICAAGACRTPTALGPADVHSVTFSLEGNVLPPESMVWFAVAAETPAGYDITCDDVYARRVQLDNACYNVLDVRYRDITQQGDTFTVTLGSFASGLRTLFVVYAHEDQRGRGALLGVSCTPYTVGAPGSGSVTLEGGPMVRL